MVAPDPPRRDAISAGWPPSGSTNGGHPHLPLTVRARVLEYIVALPQGLCSARSSLGKHPRTGWSSPADPW
jgi:hypothetical protein